MPDIRIAQVGCGGMGLRHLYGQAESQRTYGTFDYVAVCDISESAASHVAAEAERLLGKRPNVYTSFDDLLAGEPGLDAVDIVTAAGQHHTIAVQAAGAGVHVATEKPMGITVRACMTMMEAADRTGIVLSVSENYRRDPLNRLNKAILDARVLGRQRLFLDMAARGTRLMPHGTAWRHLKTAGGYMLDYAVHNADLLLYFMGPVDRVYAETHLWEQTRLVTDPEGDQMRPFYAHREPMEIERAGEVECTSEDMASGVVRFESGAMANFLSTIAAPGEGTGASIIYCDDGSIRLGGSRSGRPSAITRIDSEEPIPKGDLLGLVPDFELDDMTARIFGGERRMSSYDIDFPEIDAKIIALELEDFAEAIRTGREPEVTGQIGLDAVALTYAFLESGAINEPVSFADVAADRTNAYQQEINNAFGL